MSHTGNTTHTKAISFRDIVQGRDSYVRITDDGLIYATDLVQVMTGKTGKRAARVLRYLTDEMFSREKIIERPCHRGGHPVKFVNFDNALELVMVIPGSTATKTRVQFRKIIKRYIQGDQTLHEEIDENASSTSFLANLARESDDLNAAGETKARRKRKTEEIVDTNDNICTQAHLDFINKAFTLQKQALELRHKQEREPPLMLGVEIETVYTRALQETMKAENKILQDEDTKATEYINQMETELKLLESEQEANQLKIREQIEAIRTLSGLSNFTQTPNLTATSATRGTSPRRT